MRDWLASMSWQRLAIGFGLLLIAVSLGSSLRKALERLDEFPEHRGYAVPAARFIHFSIGGLEQIDQSLQDERGVLLYDYGGALGRQYNPLFIADFALSLVPFADDARARGLLFGNLEFLREIASTTPRGNFLFPYQFDFENVGETAPWYSAMAQARIAQAMMWGHRLSGQPEYLDTAKRAILAMAEDLPGAGLAKRLRRGLWLKEFPSYRFHVLDGSLVAIVGVHQVLEGLPAGDPDADRMRALFEAALAGFKSNHGCFSSPGGGVYFADNRWLANQSYYDIIMTHLAYLASLDTAVAEIASGYSFEDMSMVRRLIVYYWNRWAKTLDRSGLLEPCVR